MNFLLCIRCCKYFWFLLFWVIVGIDVRLELLVRLRESYRGWSVAVGFWGGVLLFWFIFCFCAILSLFFAIFRLVIRVLQMRELACVFWVCCMIWVFLRRCVGVWLFCSRIRCRCCAMCSCISGWVTRYGWRSFWWWWCLPCVCCERCRGCCFCSWLRWSCFLFFWSCCWGWSWL